MLQQLSNSVPSRNLIRFFLGFALVAVLGMNSQSVLAGDSLTTKDQIIDLMLCYATATDAIGDSTRVDPLGDGEAIYSKCFTDDAVFSAWFPGTDFSDPAQAVTIGPTGGLTGPEAWAGFVFSVFNGAYTFTQHMMSNFIVEVHGNKGTLTAYLNASHVTQDGGAVTQVAVANGTYTLQVEKIKGSWKASKLELKLINFTPSYSAAP